MNQNNLLLAFLIEFANRLKTKKPKFFTYLQYFATFVGAVTGLPEFIEFFGFKLPTALTIFENKIVAFCSASFWFASQLTSATPVAAVTKDGAVLTQTDSDKMPFTAAKEVKKAQVDEIPNTAVTLAEVKSLIPLNS